MKEISQFAAHLWPRLTFNTAAVCDFEILISLILITSLRIVYQISLKSINISKFLLIERYCVCLCNKLQNLEQIENYVA